MMRTTEEVLDEVWRDVHKKHPNSFWDMSAKKAMEVYAIEYHDNEVKKLSKANVSGQLPELFRNFIRTHHLTSKWEDYLKENEGNFR